MSKVSELTHALKPLIDSINQIRADVTGHSALLNEINAMLTALSVKSDVTEQTLGNVYDQVSQPVKKTAGRKPAVKKAPAKKPAAKKGKKTDESDDEDKKDNGTDGESDEEKESKPKKAAVKTAAKPTKKAGKKPAEKKAPASRTNKMILFKNQFKKDPNSFDKYITNKIKKELESANSEELDGLSDDKLQTKLASIYYQFIKEKHPAVLDDLKQQHAKSEEKAEGAEDADGDADQEEDAEASD